MLQYFSIHIHLILLYCNKLKLRILLQKPKRLSVKKENRKQDWKKIFLAHLVYIQGLIEVHKESQSMSLIKFESKRSNTRNPLGQRLNYYVQTFMNQALFNCIVPLTSNAWLLFFFHQYQKCFRLPILLLYRNLLCSSKLTRDQTIQIRILPSISKYSSRTLHFIFRCQTHEQHYGMG